MSNGCGSEPAGTLGNGGPTISIPASAHRAGTLMPPRESVNQTLVYVPGNLNPISRGSIRLRRQRFSLQDVASPALAVREWRSVSCTDTQWLRARWFLL